MTEQPMCPSTNLKACRICSQRVLGLTVAGNVLMTGLKLAGGAFTTSSGLIADGLQSLSCVATSILIMISMAFSQRASDERFPYGYAKIEFIAALSAFSVLIGLGVYIVLSNFLAIMRREFVQPDIMALPIVMVSAFLTYMMYRYNFCAGTKLESPGMVANACHAGADLFSSGAVIVAIVVAQIGPAFAVCDKIAALIVGVIIIKDALGHWMTNLQVVLDRVPDPGFQRRIDQLISRDFPPHRMSGMKFKRVGKKFWLGISLQGPAGGTVAESQAVQEAIRTALTEAFAEVGQVELFIELGGEGMNFDRMAKILGQLREVKAPLKTTEAVRGPKKAAGHNEDGREDDFLDFLSSKTKAFGEFDDMAAFAVSILRASTYPFFVVDKDMKIQFMNPACLEFTGLNLNDAIDKVKCAQIFNSDLCEKNCAIKQAMKTRKSVIGKRVKVIDRIGRDHTIVVSAGPLIDKNGRVLGGFEVWRDAMPDEEVSARTRHLLSAVKDYCRTMESFLEDVGKREFDGKDGRDKLILEMKKRTGDLKIYCSTTMKSNCWEILNCPAERQVQCPSFPNHGAKCWEIDHTWCDGQMQGAASDKKDKCRKCLVHIRGKLK